MADAEKKQYFSEDEQMDFEIQLILGSCYYGAADAGEVLSAIDMLKPGDAESWVQAWQATAERVQGYAEKSDAAGNRVSAREAYLRAANYFAGPLSMIDGTEDPSRGESYWKQHMACWEEFCARLDPPAEKIEIPYGPAPMPAWFFKPDDSSGPFPTVIFNNGSDGPTASMWGSGTSGALRRGYAALVFDGPGQNSMLWLHGVPFRHDWEKVITPVVDTLVARPDVDASRIALSGLSQAGYWVLRALAFEHRIAAGIVDPGVMDVATAGRAKMPKEMIDLLNAGDEKTFNEWMARAMDMDPTGKSRREIEWRMKPYATHNFYEWFKWTEDYNARDIIKDIKCPMFVADPDDEQFWPGQSQEVYDALESPKAIVKFTREEGANWHCEPKARSLYDQRMFDWLATVM
jgi:dienelactone hydrolase